MVTLTSKQLLTVVAASSVAFLTYYIVRKVKYIKRNWRPVATVTELLIYPIKCCRPVSVEKLKCFDYGCENFANELSDRSLMLVNDKGNRISGPAYPVLTTVNVERVGNGRLKVSVKGKNSIEFRIPDVNTKKPNVEVRLFGEHGYGIKCSDEICNWFSELLGVEVKLLYHDKNKALFSRDKLNGYDEITPCSKQLVKARFQNFSPLNLLSISSLVDLNKRLKRPVSTLNFRANVVIEGSPPYEEDEWRHIRIGTTELLFAKHCNRCPQTTVDRRIGVIDKSMQPLATLKTYRQPANEKEHKLYKGMPKFAIDLVPIQAGEISVGDTVYVQ